MSRPFSILTAWLLALGLVACAHTGTKPKDVDGDGIEDSKDACLSTAPGAKVDQTGCESGTDTDGDGVPDAGDACRDTPPGTPVDGSGCDPDRDADGVSNSRDACPGTPAGVKVDMTGCETDARHDERDADADGSPDGQDKCPNTPLGTIVDAHGCPRVADADGDGVADGRDRCPKTSPGDLVDPNGCSMPRKIILKGVNFETGSARLSAEAEQVLDNAARTLVANPTVRVRIGGHTDTTGSSALNLRLSRERAEAVRQYLISKGVNAANLTVVAFAAGEPIGDNATPAGRAANRRVELKIIR